MYEEMLQFNNNRRNEKCTVKSGRRQNTAGCRKPPVTVGGSVHCGHQPGSTGPVYPKSTSPLPRPSNPLLRTQPRDICVPCRVRRTRDAQGSLVLGGGKWGQPKCSHPVRQAVSKTWNVHTMQLEPWTKGTQRTEYNLNGAPGKIQTEQDYNHTLTSVKNRCTPNSTRTQANERPLQTQQKGLLWEAGGGRAKQ